MPRNEDVRISRNRQTCKRVGEGVEAHKHHGVGASGKERVVAFLAFAFAGVDYVCAHKENVYRLYE